MNTIPVMINGLPGNVAKVLISSALKDDRFTIVPLSLTGEDVSQTHVNVENIDIELVKPSVRDKQLADLMEEYPKLVAIDFTHPTAVNANARFYAQHRIPFVMGTTGGDRDALEETVKKSASPAVIAPNMAKQIVGFQAMMEYAAKTFPDLFKGYTLEVKESHQQGKADTSGTAKAIVSCFNCLGAEFNVKDIQKIRDPEIQEKEWGIPKEHISGHGWHTYTLSAEDGSALFEFKHNINGRDIYAAGTFDAVVFLRQKADQVDNDQKFYTMIDVMTQG